MDRTSQQTTQTSLNQRSRIERRALLGLIGALLLVSLTACHGFPFPMLWDSTSTSTPGGESPLPPIRMSSDSVVLDIYSVQLMPGDRATYNEAWDLVDEQQLSASTRRELRNQGFRAGVVGYQLPGNLARLMELENKPAPTPGMIRTQITQDAQDAERIQRRHLQVRPGEETTIQTSGIMPEISLLQRDDAGRVSGKTLFQARTMFQMKTETKNGDHVRVKLVPIIEHGEMRGQFSGNRGRLVYERTPLKELFESLTIEVTLSPGRMLLIGPDVNCDGTVAEHFFCGSDQSMNTGKFFLIRLIQTQQDDLFDSESR